MKYIIDIPDDAKYGILTCKVDRGYYTKDIDLSETEQLTADYINEHYGQLQDEAYKRGLEDGKAVHDKGCEGCRYNGTPQGDSPCFNCSNYYQNNWTAKDDEIRIGDEVIGTAGHRGFVTKPINSESVYVVWEDGSCGANDLMDLKKTGRTRYDIERILEAMNHD